MRRHLIRDSAAQTKLTSVSGVNRHVNDQTLLLPRGRLWALLAWVLGMLLVAALACPPAPAANRSASGKSALRDCLTHQGVLSQAYERSALVSAYRALPANARLSDCAQGIASQLALGADRGTVSTSAVQRDCVEHGGRLTRAYRRTTLLATLQALSLEARTETRCLIGIYSQMRGRGSRVALRFPRSPVQRTELDRESGAAVTQAMTERFTAFRRARSEADELPARARGFAVNENRRTNDDLVVEQSRRVSFSLRGIWVVGARGSVCAIRNFGGVATGIACDSASQVAEGNPVLAVSPAPKDAGWEIWGAAPDSLSSMTAIERPGRRKVVRLSGNGLALRLPRIPVALTWRSADGHQHYYDTTRVPCGPSRTRCVQLADPVRASARNRRSTRQP